MLYGWLVSIIFIHLFIGIYYSKYTYYKYEMGWRMVVRGRGGCGGVRGLLFIYDDINIYLWRHQFRYIYIDYTGHVKIKNEYLFVNDLLHPLHFFFIIGYRLKQFATPTGSFVYYFLLCVWNRKTLWLKCVQKAVFALSMKRRGIHRWQSETMR